MIVKPVTGPTLAVLRAMLELDREAYGMEIAKHARLQRSSCYMILKRLVKNGCLTTRWDHIESDGRPPRKYYALVPERRAEVVELLTKRGIELPEVAW